MDKKVDWMKTPAENFLLKSSEFESEKDSAQYFEMGLTDYRATRWAAKLAARANLMFTIRYYQGTHPLATMAEVAESIGTSESVVRELLENG